MIVNAFLAPDNKLGFLLAYIATHCDTLRDMHPIHINYNGNRMLFTKLARTPHILKWTKKKINKQNKRK